MGLNQIELLSIEDTKRKRISFTGVSRLSLIYIWRVSLEPFYKISQNIKYHVISYLSLSFINLNIS